MARELIEMDTGLGGDRDRAERLADALAACAAGERSGLDVVLSIEGPQMLGLADRILKRHDLAEEALQDALVSIWQKSAQFRRESGSARGWIYAILRNRCLSILRDGHRLQLLPPDDLAALQDARQDTVDDADWTQMVEPSRLKTCLEGLDDQMRAAILHAYVGGYSHSEIAARQSVPLGTAKSWIRRGLVALRECLQ